MVEATKMCRTCLKQNFEMLHLFSEVLLDKPALIKDILMNITTIEVAKADGLPEMICSLCLQELKRAFSFIKMCETSDTALRCNSAPQEDQNPVGIEREIDFENIKPEPETEIQFLNVKPDPEMNLDMEIDPILDVQSGCEIPSLTELVHSIDDENHESDIQETIVKRTTSKVAAIKSMRGRNLLVLNNFTYFKQTVLKSGEAFWRCTKRNVRCCAKIYTVGPENTITRTELIHNHEPDTRSKLNRKIVSEACKRMAKEDIAERPSKIIDLVLEQNKNIIDNVKDIDIKYIRRNMYNKRRQQHDYKRNIYFQL